MSFETKNKKFYKNSGTKQNVNNNKTSTVKSLTHEFFCQQTRENHLRRHFARENLKQKLVFRVNKDECRIFLTSLYNF